MVIAVLVSQKFSAVNSTASLAAQAFAGRVQVFDSQRNYLATLGETSVSGTDNAHFSDPWGVAVDGQGNIFVADHNNSRVQKCALNGSGGGTCAPFAGVTGMPYRDFPYLTSVNAVAVDGQGRVYIADDWEQRVQVFDANGAYLTTIGGSWGPRVGEFRNPYSLAVDPQGNIFVADRLNHRIQKFSPGVPGWDQMNLNGFGDVWNQGVTTLEVFNGQLYASSVSWNIGARIWRSADGTNWQPVNDYGFGMIPMPNAVIDSIVYSGKLYYGLGWSGGSAQVWRTNGTSWEQITTDGFGNTDNHSAYAFAAYGGNLYVALANDEDGLEVWRSTSGDAGSWSNVMAGGMNGDAQASHITSMVVFNSKLVAYVTNKTLGLQIWEYNGSTWTQVNSDDFGDANNIGDGGGLVVQGSYLYAGTHNEATGAQVWRMDTSHNWTMVVGDGFADIHNYKVDGFYAAPSGTLHAIAVNDITGMELWGTTNSGVNWAQTNIDGFGDFHNNSSLFGNAITTFNHRMFVGTWNFGGNGGEVWASKPSAYTLFGQVNGLQAGDVVTIHLLQNGNLFRTQELTASGASVAYNFADLGSGTYRIIAHCGYYVFTPYSYTAYVTTAGMPPLNFTASARGALALVQPLNSAKPSESSFNLEWQAAPGVGIKYQLQVSTSPTFTTFFKNLSGLVSTRYLLTGAVKNTLYFWRVRPYTGAAPAAAAPWSAAWSFTTPNPPAAPVMTLPAVGAVTNLSPFFRWNAPLGAVPAASYRLQISQQASFATLDVEENISNAENWFYLNQSLIFNKAYFWRVRAFAANGDASPWTVGRKFITLPEQPWLDWPCDWCTAETLRPTFQWNDNTNTGAYQIVISKFGATFLTKDVVGKSFTPTVNLVPGERYWWRVRGKGLGGYGPWSDIRTFWAPYPPNVPVLTAPANNSVISGAGKLQWRPTFTWNSVPGAAHYRLQVSKQPTFPDWDMRLRLDLDNNSFDWGGPGAFVTNNPDWLEPNKAYYWRVQSCNERWECSIWSPTWKFFTRPGGLQAHYPGTDEYVSTAEFYLGWGGLPWPEQYVDSLKFTVQFSTSPLFATVAKTIPVTNQWWTKAALAAPGVYYWRVRAEGVGGLNGFGAWTDPVRFNAEAPLAAPLQVAPAAGATVPNFNNILLDWNAVAGGVNYNVQVSTDPAFNYVYHSNWYQNDTQWGLSVSPGVYYWRVSANNNHGVRGNWSAARKFATLSGMDVYVNDFLNGAPLGNVEVRAVKVGAPAVNFNCTTNNDGYCWFQNLPPATYTLTATSPLGYLNFGNTATVILGASKWTYQWFELVRQPAPGVLAVVTTWPSSANRVLENHMWQGSGAAQTHIHPGYQGLRDDTHNPPNIRYETGSGGNTRVMLIAPTSLPGGDYPFAVQQVSPGPVVPLKSFGVKVAVFDTFGNLVAGPYGPPTLGSGQWWYVFRMNKSAGSTTFVNSPAPLGTLLPNAPVASNPGTLSGCAVTTSNAPIPNLPIRISGPAYADIFTDQNGCWSLNGLPAGNYQILPDSGAYPGWSPAVPLVVNGFNPANDTYSGTLVGTPGFDVFGEATSLKVQGQYAYALFGESLEVINIADRSHPTFVSRTQIAPHDGGVLGELALGGNYAYIVGDNGLTVVNIANPASPQIAGVYGGLSRGQDIALAGKYAYVTTLNGLYVLDVSSPAHPRLVGSRYLSYGATARIELRGNFLHMAYHYPYADDSYYRIWDVSNPSWPLSVYWEWVMGNLTDITINNEQIFLSGYGEDGMGGMKSVVLSAPFHCGPDWPCGLRMYDLQGAANGTGSAQRIAVLYNQRYPFLADANDGLIAVDANDVWNLWQTGFYATAGSTDIELDGKYAYLLKDDRLMIFHAGDPTNPNLAGSYVP